MTEKKTIITISRQYGSGGRDIGRAIADKLGLAYYDKELISRAAESSNIAAKFFEEGAEQVKNPLAYFLSFTAGSSGEADTLPVSDRIFLTQAEVIRNIADEGNCLIVGHCADYVLDEYEGVVNIFIHADWESRVARVAERNNLTLEQAEVRIKKTDKARSTHYQHYTDKKWGRAENYDLCLSSSKLGVDGVVEMVLKYLETV